MFDLDKWQEIFASLRKNWLRTLLTSISVAWGIFILIVLLGSGKGLENGVTHMFRDDAINSIWMFGGKTSKPYKGLKPGRDTRFTNEDHDLIEAQVAGVEHISSRFYLRGSVTVTYKNEFGSFDVRCVHPAYAYIENSIILAGRYINDRDVEGYRKVVCIGRRVQDALFKKENPIGKHLMINGIAFKVVGIFRDEGSDQEEEKVYIPISTAQRAFGGANRVNQVMFTIGDATLEESQVIADDLLQEMSQKHLFDPEDQRAIRIRNNVLEFQRFQKVLGGIAVFIWVIGIMTIIAGVVGVSNIMLIVVKERTKEIGIRKAIGATPRSIVMMILQEAIFLTSVSGYIGLVAGIGLLELVNNFMPPTPYFRYPEVDLRVAITAVIILVVAGAIAGLFPALKAASIRPIEALRAE